jgi:hypothetical protein
LLLPDHNPLQTTGAIIASSKMGLFRNKGWIIEIAALGHKSVMQPLLELQNDKFKELKL